MNVALDCHEFCKLMNNGYPSISCWSVCFGEQDPMTGIYRHQDAFIKYFSWEKCCACWESVERLRQLGLLELSKSSLWACFFEQGVIQLVMIEIKRSKNVACNLLQCFGFDGSRFLVQLQETKKKVEILVSNSQELLHGPMLEHRVHFLLQLEVSISPWMICFRWQKSPVTKWKIWKGQKKRIAGIELR